MRSVRSLPYGPLLVQSFPLGSGQEMSSIWFPADAGSCEVSGRAAATWWGAGVKLFE